MTEPGGESRTHGTKATLVLNWVLLTQVGMYGLVGVYGLLPRTVFVVWAWACLITGSVNGLLHVLDWRSGGDARPRLFYREES